MRLLRGVVISWLICTTPGIRATTAPLDAANDAWDRGDYIAALNGYVQLLNGPGGDRFVEPIALQTGELYVTRELTPDGRAPRFSPDGKLVAYETGLETSRRTKILSNDGSFKEVADLPGVSATFSSTLPQVAYLKIPDNEEMRRASDALERASLTASNRTQLTQTLTWLIAKHAAIVVRDLPSGREMELPAPELLKTGLTFSADGRVLYFLGGIEGDDARTDIYVISEAAPKPVMVVDAPGLKGPFAVDAGGKALIYVVPAQSPLRRPATGGRGRGPASAGSAAADPARGRGTAAPSGASRPPATFAIVNLAARRVSTVAGTAPTLSADGGTLAFVTRSGADYALMTGPTLGAHSTLKQTPLRIDAPALSPTGDRIAFQMMFQDDWEIVVVNRDGTGERRVTRDIQHDILPRFVGENRLLALIGEPRHRRSYLYDLDAGARSSASAVRTTERQPLTDNG